MSTGGLAPVREGLWAECLSDRDDNQRVDHGLKAQFYIGGTNYHVIRNVQSA
jgi:hypothetical protein